jgi:osmotically-inducible protein OsmY
MKNMQVFAGLALAASMALPGVGHAATQPAAVVASGMAMGQASDAQLQADVQKKLNNGKFKNVTVAVQGAEVTLTGTVDVYQTKLDADNKAHHVKGVKGVDNEIQVAGKDVPDAQLYAQLGKKLAYDRAGWPDQAFNNITLGVSNGVVSLGGSTAVPWAKESALAVVQNTAGVKDVVDDISVDPTSPMDDQTRIAVYRRVYGQAALNKYALDPAKPIRITVINGNVTLNGVVDSKMDKDIAGIQANQVPGVFKVTNDLVVANQGSEKR